jgi:hypothetical protein
MAQDTSERYRGRSGVRLRPAAAPQRAHHRTKPAGQTDQDDWVLSKFGLTARLLGGAWLASARLAAKP